MIMQQLSASEPTQPDYGRVSFEGPALITFVLGAVAYIFVDIHYGTTNKLVDYINDKFGLHFLERRA